MKGRRIERVEVVDCSDLARAGDNAHVVAVHAAGLTGWYGPVSAAAGALIDTCIAPLAVGALVVDHEGLLTELRHALGTPVGAMTSWAVGALDCAVWDLHARAEGRPVAALLSAAGHRTSVPAYASWLRLDIGAASNTDSISRVASEGWRFTKWGLRPDPRLDVEEDAHRLAMLVKEVAEVAGAPAAFDALWTWDHSLTLRFSEVVDQAGLVWLEEPLSTYNLPYYAALAASGPSVALGERLHLGDDPTGLLRLTGLGAFTLDVVGCGGLTTATRLTEQARASGVPVYPHGRSLSPAVHLAAAFPDAVAAVEYQVQWEPRRQQLFTETMPCDAGQVLVPAAPGLGPVPRRR